jgi:hypothetical protein
MCGSKASEGYGSGGNSNGILTPLIIVHVSITEGQIAIVWAKNQVFHWG